MTKTLLFGTGNTTKRERFRNLLGPLGIEIISLVDVKVSEQPVEDGQTPEENALKKARFYFAETNLPTFAVDYGLYIDYFPPERQPGLFVRRIGENKEKATDEEMLSYYVQELGKHGGESPGRWKYSIALVVAPELEFMRDFVSETLLTAKMSDQVTPGEPLNSIQFVPELGKYKSELSPDEYDQLVRTNDPEIINFFKERLGVD